MPKCRCWEKHGRESKLATFGLEKVIDLMESIIYGNFEGNNSRAKWQIFPIYARDDDDDDDVDSNIAVLTGKDVMFRMIFYFLEMHTFLIKSHSIETSAYCLHSAVIN